MNTQNDTRSETVFIGITFVLVLLAIPGLVGIVFILRYIPSFLLMLATLVVPALLIVNAILKGRQAIFSIGFSVLFVLLSCSPTIPIFSIGSLSGARSDDIQGLAVLNNLVCLVFSCIFGWICMRIFGTKRSSQTPTVGESSASDS